MPAPYTKYTSFSLLQYHHTPVINNSVIIYFRLKIRILVKIYITVLPGIQENTWQRYGFKIARKINSPENYRVVVRFHMKLSLGGIKIYKETV